MYEYKVDIYKVKYAQDAMNTYAKEGWRVIAVTPDHHTGFLDVFYEREKLLGNEETGAFEEKYEEAEELDDDDDEDIDGSDETARYAVREDIWDFEGEEEESGDNE